MSELIYYVGPFSFPNGGAAARRIYGNINTLREIGYEVKVIDGQPIVGKSSYDGIDVISVGERPPQNISWCKKVFKYLHIGKNTVDYIKSGEVKPRFIVLYSGYSPYLMRLLPFCKKNNIKLIFDCVEWYQPKKFLEYMYNPYYWNIELAMRYLIPMCDGVICISRFLENIYSDKTTVINIPPTVLTSSIPQNNVVNNSFDRIKLVYSGSPGSHKDFLDIIISAVSGFSDRYELHIAGINGINSDNIFYHGHISHSESLRLVSDSHFSILVRPYNKVSRAGFSTKVVESLSCGTPVITNNTGDLGHFIKNGENGFIFDGVSQKDLCSTLSNIALIFNGNYYDKLSQAAFSLSASKFDCKIYTVPLNIFLSKL